MKLGDGDKVAELSVERLVAGSGCGTLLDFARWLRERCARHGSVSVLPYGLARAAARCRPHHRHGARVGSRPCGGSPAQRVRPVSARLPDAPAARRGSCVASGLSWWRSAESALQRARCVNPGAIRQLRHLRQPWNHARYRAAADDPAERPGAVNVRATAHSATRRCGSVQPRGRPTRYTPSYRRCVSGPNPV